MNSTEKWALGAGAFVGTLGWIATAWRIRSDAAKITALKIDNINLLSNTTQILNCVNAGAPIPEELLVDIRFRAMAFMTEYEDVEDEDD